MTLEEDMTLLNGEIETLKINRPGTKQEYLAALALLQTQKRNLQLQIVERNLALNAAAEAATIENNNLPVTRWKEIRKARNKLLSESDWTQMPDSPLLNGKKTAWLNYRKLLRDIPQTYTTPGAVVWPPMPN